MDEKISKSQKKRDASALQKLGLELIDLSVSKLENLPLTDSLRKAIIDAKAITSHGAKRRQAQLIGKLMRAADSEEIATAYNDLQAEGKAQTSAFHEAEQWRNRLIESPETLADFIDSYHPGDIQQLRQILKKAVDDFQKEKNTGGSKALFRYIRSCIE